MVCCRLHQHVDFVVCLGGDGTILHASSLFQRAIPPVVSFSAGSLGFLTNLSLKNVESDLHAVIYGCEDLDQCSLGEKVRANPYFTFFVHFLAYLEILFSQGNPEEDAS